MSFGGSVKLTGESEYRKSLREITSSLKLVSSELKLTNAEFEDGDKTLKDTKKAYDNMGNTLEDQKKKVADLRKELEKAEKEYGENNTQVKNFKTQLNKAETELKQLEKATDKSTDELKDLKKGFQDTGKQASTFGDVLKANILGDVIVDGLRAIGSAVVDIGKQAIGSYADYEQLVGGVDTLFKESSSIVQSYAQNAYKTAGLSANEYMETVTSFSASLLQSLNNDTAKSAEVANMAITDMADNANKMGTSMEMIQNAYQGFAKQNYTMLDNLKLGYGGTKTEMERLLEDATKLSGIEYDIDNLNDVYQAIHVIQTELGITGTTAKESSDTISGSIATMKSAWENLLTGIASGEQIDTIDTYVLVHNWVESIKTVAKNLIPVIQSVIQSIGGVVSQSLQEALPPEIFDPIWAGFEWIIDNADLIISSIAGITGALATLKLGAIAVAITGLITKVGGIAGILATIKGAVVGLVATVGGPVTLIIAGVVGIVTALTTLWHTNEDFRNAVIGAWENIKEVFSNVWGAITEFFTVTLPEVWANVVEFFAGIPEWFSGIWQSVLDTFMAWGENIRIFFTETIPQMFTDALNFIHNLLVTWGNNISNFFTVTIPALWQSLMDWFNSLPEKIGFALGYVIGTISKWGGQVREYLITNVPIWIDNVVKFFSEMPDKIWTWLKNTFDKIATWGTNVKNKAVEVGTEFINSIVKFFSELPGKVWEWLTNAWNNITTWATNVKEKAVEIGTNFVTTISTFFSELPGKVWTWLSNTISKVSDFASDLWDKGIEAGTNLVTSIVDTVSGIPDKMAEIGSNLVEGLWNGINNMATWIWDKISGFCDGVVDGVKTALGINSPSKVMEDEVGENMALGVGSGFKKMMSTVNKEMANAIQTDYDLAVNSNLTGTPVESEYTEMVKAFKEALAEVKVVMDDREMGTFVTDTMERVVYA